MSVNLNRDYTHMEHNTDQKTQFQDYEKLNIIQYEKKKLKFILKAFLTYTCL
jgi:hypothetical protein